MAQARRIPAGDPAAAWHARVALQVRDPGEEMVLRRGSLQAMEVQRTLVKSPPELWAEVSDVEALTRHLAAFGEITITRVEPESTVAWEGEHASGTVELSASGWGTKVTLSAQPAETPEPVAVAEPEPQIAPEPDPDPDPEPAHRRRWRFWSRAEIPAPPAPTPDPAPPTPTPEPGPPAPPDPNPPQISFDPNATEAVLTKVLDDLGQAHHRPFTR